MKGLYIIFDIVAVAMLGTPFIHGHNAAAVRTFTDIASTDKTLVNQHPADYELVRIGTMDEQGNITETERTTIITGAAWLASQQAANNNLQLMENN